MKWGLLGGSFNPVHNGHLAVAARVAEALKLDRILFIPTAVSPLKDARDLAPAEDRLAMVRLAVRGEPRFAAGDLEVRRGGVSYSIDTVRQLRRRTNARFYLIVGEDAARQFPRWKEIEELGRRVRFVLVARPGHRAGRGMPKHHRVRAPLLEISGTEIRRRVRKGLSLRGLVPEAVERYLRRKGLYR
jgi:nicotinate-nucleotide adenylyltransferase